MTMIGRQKEQDVLDKIFNSNAAEFIAIYGRRRVGKTYLVRAFFKKKMFLFSVEWRKKSKSITTA